MPRPPFTPPRLAASLALSLAMLATVAQAQQADTSKPAPVVAPTSATVSIGGIGPGVDARAFARVKLTIGLAVADGTLSYFNVDGWGKEGGFSACIEKSRFAADGSFERVLKALRAIRPDPSTSFYSVTPGTGTCTYPVNAAPTL